MSPSDVEDAVLRELAHLLAERFAAAAGKVPEKQHISGLTIPLNPGLIRWRRIAMITLFVVFPIPVVELFISATGVSPLSTITIATSIVLMVLLMLETVTLTGVKVESEYKLGSSFGRDFRFYPSIKSVIFLAGILFLAIFGFVLGFAGIYSWFYRSSHQNFTNSLDPISSVYFSMVTFATVGYGDIAPASALLRLITTIQIAFSWISIALLFSVTIPWIITNHQRRLDDLIQKDRQRMERTEEILREASLGVYGDYDALVAEAKARVANKNKETP